MEDSEDLSGNESIKNLIIILHKEDEKFHPLCFFCKSPISAKTTTWKHRHF